MRRISIAVVALSLALAGCFWPVPGQNADRTAYNNLEDTISADNVEDLQQIWTWSFPAAVAVHGPVVSTAGVHVVVPQACRLYTLDPVTGAQRWFGDLTLDEFNFPCVYLPPASGVIGESPFVVGDEVFAGMVRWADLPGEPRYAHWTRGFDLATGAPTSVTREGALVAYRDGVAIGSDTDPSEAWRTNRGALGAATWTPAGIPGDPQGYATIGAGGEVLYLTGSGMLRAFSLTESHPGCIQECPLWATPTSGQPADRAEAVLDPDGTRLYLGSSTGTMSAYDTATGAVVWTATAGAAVTDSPALALDRLYVPTATGLAVLDASDGTVLWTAATGSAINPQPAVAGGVVFTASQDGTVHAFDAAGCGFATCPPLWSASTGTAAITEPPIVSQGRLIVATTDGRVVAYGLPGGGD